MESLHQPHQGRTTESLSHTEAKKQQRGLQIEDGEKAQQPGGSQDSHYVKTLFNKAPLRGEASVDAETLQCFPEDGTDLSHGR